MWLMIVSVAVGKPAVGPIGRLEHVPHFRVHSVRRMVHTLEKSGTPLVSMTSFRLAASTSASRAAARA